MSGNKTKEQLLAELIEFQKLLEEKIETQDRMIQKFQVLSQNEGLFSQVIHYFPYPLVVFTRDGVIKMANQVFFTETNRDPVDISEGRINMLSRITTENYEVLESIQGTFSGEMKLLRNLIAPLSMFARDNDSLNPKNYGSAIFFPLTGSDG